MGGAGGAVHPVGGDDQVVVGGELGGGRGGGAEAEVDAEAGAALVQDLQEPSAAEGGEAVAAGGVGPAPVDDVDRVPADELAAERPVHLGVGVLDGAEGLVGEDDAEAEGVVGGVALEDRDRAVRVEPFEEGRGVEAARAAADDRDPAHGRGVPARGGRRVRAPGGFGGGTAAPGLRGPSGAGTATSPATSAAASR